MVLPRSLKLTESTECSLRVCCKGRTPLLSRPLLRTPKGSRYLVAGLMVLQGFLRTLLKEGCDFRLL
jgi:hypothetical protein